MEIDDYKVNDRVYASSLIVYSTDKFKGITTGPGGQDSNNSPDVDHLDIVEETHSNQHDSADVDHKREKVFDACFASMELLT